MRKRFVAFLVAVALAVVAAIPLSAETELGQLCFRGTTFADTLRLTLVRSTTAGSIAVFHVYGRWRGSTAYQIPVSGALTTADGIAPAATHHFALTGTHGTTFYGGNHNCGFFGTLGPTNVTIQCSGGTNPNFQVNVPMTQVACTATMDEEQSQSFLPVAGGTN